ncbi:nuclear condensing complex subunit [Chytridium lagenaria]|nr:nuclear condensing complex subunit [Chytridium lagenaria]
MLCEQLWVNAEANLYNFAKVLDVFSNDTAEIALKSLMMSPKFDTTSLENLFGLMKTDQLDYIVAFVVRIALHIKSESETVDSICDHILTHFGSMLQAPTEEVAIEREFLLKQLISMVEYYDFSDELGRRSFVDLAKELLQTAELPPDFIPIILRILKLHINEEELFLHVAEVVVEMTGNNENAMSEVDADPNSSVIALQALEITRSTLEISEKNMYSSVYFQCLLHRMILPSIKSSNVVLRESGIHCLGLACGHSKALTVENADFFLYCFNSGESKDIKMKSLQIIFDLVMIHGAAGFSEDTILSAAKIALSSADTKMLTIAVEGTSKLLRSNFVSDVEIIEAFIILYFHPHTVSNQRLSQCLSFFMPWFSLSAYANQQLVVKTLSGIYEVSTSDITLLDVLKQMAEWTDARLLQKEEKEKESEDNDIEKPHCHLEILINLMEETILEPDFGITACTALNTLHIEAKTWSDNSEKIMGLISKVNMVMTPSLICALIFLLKMQAE